MAPMVLEDQIAMNKRRTVYIMIMMFLIIALLVYFMAVVAGYFFLGGGVPFGFFTIIAVVVAGLYIWSTFHWSVKEVIRATGARPAKPEVREEKLLIWKVEELSIASGHNPPPKVYVMDSQDINAYATGKKPEDSIIAITTGALEKLNQEELEGVLAHELSHIRNRDVLLTTATIAVVGTIAVLSEMLIRLLFYGSIMGRGGRGGGGGPAVLVLFVVAIIFVILAPIFARLTYLALSRKREYLADATGAYLTRNPDGLSSALKKIKQEAPKDPKGSPTAAGLYLANPFKRARKGNLWATHPPLDERIRRLGGV